MAPGSIYVRVVASSGFVISAHPIGDTSVDKIDLVLATAHRHAHPDETICVNLYDGDTGQRTKILVWEPI